MTEWEANAWITVIFMAWFCGCFGVLAYLDYPKLPLSYWR